MSSEDRSPTCHKLSELEPLPSFHLLSEMGSRGSRPDPRIAETFVCPPSGTGPPAPSTLQKPNFPCLEKETSP